MTSKTLITLIFSILIWTSVSSQGGGNMLDFDGVNDHIGMGTMNLSGTELTISTWIFVDQFQVNFPYISTVAGIEGTGSTALFRIGDAGLASDLPQFILYISGTQQKLDAVTPLLPGQWYHIAATYDNSDLKIYINGKLDASRSVSGAFNANDLFWIAQSYGSSRYLNGKMDEIRLWNVAVKENNIVAYMHKPVGTTHSDYANLLGYWRLNEASGGTAKDSSINGNDGQLTSIDTAAAWVKSDAPMGSLIMEELDNVKGVWERRTDAGSSILTVSSKNILHPDAIIFGHNGGNLTFTSLDVPTADSIDMRLERIWIFEQMGNAGGDLIFDLTSIDTSNVTGIRLLVDNDDVFSDASTYTGTWTGNEFNVVGAPIQHGNFYTLGVMKKDTVANPGIEDVHNGLLQFDIYPNPTSSEYTVYLVFEKAGFTKVSLRNVLGQEIEVLYEGKLGLGIQKLKGDRSGSLYEGLYIIVVETEQSKVAAKMIFTR